MEKTIKYQLNKNTSKYNEIKFDVYLVASGVAAGRGSHGRRERFAGGGAKSREEARVRRRHDNITHRNRLTVCCCLNEQPWLVINSAELSTVYIILLDIVHVFYTKYHQI